MPAIFLDLIEKCIEVFIDDFSVFGSSFESKQGSENMCRNQLGAQLGEMSFYG